MTKPEYLDLLCNNAIGIQNAKEPDPKFKEVMIKALTSLKAFVNDPTSYSRSTGSESGSTC